MAQPEPGPAVNPNEMFLALFLFLAFFATLIFSFRWGEVRYGWLVVAGFNLFAWVTLLLFVLLFRKAQGATPQSERGFLVSASTIGGWTMLFGIEILFAFMALVATSPSPAVGFVLLGVLGFATGLLMGSPHLKPQEHAGLAFAIGYIGAFAGLIVSYPFISMEIRSSFSGPDLIPGVALAGIISVLEGGACALGSLLGGSLRRQRALEVATA
jgi:hypothetical protein